MSLELKEFRDIVDADWSPGRGVPKPPGEEDLTRALQVLLTHQCIYASTAVIGRSYDIVRAYRIFFEKYFAALGYELIVNARDQMIALSVPSTDQRYDWRYARFRKDETLVLLALKLAYEEGIKENRIGDGGTVEITTNEILDKLQAVARAEPPPESRLMDILGLFKRKGYVRLGQHDKTERVTPVVIMPGIDVVAPESYLEHLKSWAEQASQASVGEETNGAGETRAAAAAAEQDDDEI